MIERIRQRIRYFPWWLWHPIQYHRSEQMRRACNLIAQMFIDEGWTDGKRVGLHNEQEGYMLGAMVEKYE